MLASDYDDVEHGSASLVMWVCSGVLVIDLALVIWFTRWAIRMLRR